MKTLFYIVLFFAFSSSAFSGNSDKEKNTSRIVTGKVTDTYGEAIAGAKVTVSETGETFFADMEGNFKFEVKTDKVYSITVNTIGYAPLSLKSNALSAFSELELNSL